MDNEPSGEIVRRLQDLEDKLDKKGKDIWDKLNSISGLVSGIVIALIGFYAANVYNEHLKEADLKEKERAVAATEAQTVEKFFPHLVSTDVREQQAAIEMISTVASSELAAKIARTFGGPGAIAAITKISSLGDSKSQSVVWRALDELYQKTVQSTGLLEVWVNDPAFGPTVQRGEFIVLNKEGLALTTALLFKGVERSDGQNGLQILARVGGSDAAKESARLINIDQKHGLAVIKLPNSNYVPAQFAQYSISPGAPVSVVKYGASSEYHITTGQVSQRLAEDTQISFTLFAGSEENGGAVFDDSGAVVGMIVGKDNSQGLAVLAENFPQWLGSPGAPTQTRDSHN